MGCNAEQAFHFGKVALQGFHDLDFACGVQICGGISAYQAVRPRIVLVSRCVRTCVLLTCLTVQFVVGPMLSMLNIWREACMYIACSVF